MSGLVLSGVREKMTRRFAGIVIGSQSLVVFFGALVAYAIAKSQGQSAHGTYLAVGCVIAVLCIVAAGSMRRPWGITLGWLIQLVTIASAVIVPMMLIVGLVFLALWITALVQGEKMDQLTRDYVEAS